MTGSRITGRLAAGDSSWRARRWLLPLLATLLGAGGIVAGTASPALATVTVGYSCAYYTNVSLNGGPYGSQGCPTQTSSYATANSLAPSLSWQYGVTQSVSDSDGAKASYGPAVLFSSPYDVNGVAGNSAALTVQAYGTTTINAVARAYGVGPSPFYTLTPTSYPVSAPSNGYVDVRCTATSPTTHTASVTVKDGRVDTATDANGEPISTVVVPNPTPVNYRVNFTINSVGDHGHMVFNEQISNADGSITVNGAHMYMEGPFALGDVIIAQVICGHS